MAKEAYGATAVTTPDLEQRDVILQSEEAQPKKRVAQLFALSVMAVTMSSAFHGRIGSGTPPGGMDLRAAAEGESKMKFDKVKCGSNAVMRLSCDVTFGVPVKALSAGLSEVLLHHAPRGDSASPVYSSANLTKLEPEATVDGYTFYTITVYRLRPVADYVFALIDVRGNVITEAHTRTTETGICSSLDAGAKLSEVEGRATYELLLFSWMKGTFRGIAAVDKAGYLVWYSNISATSVDCVNGDCGTSVNVHIEAFGQIKEGPYAGSYCVNNYEANSNRAGVMIIRPSGYNEARIKSDDLKPSKHAAKTYFEGHECRPTSAGNILITGFEDRKIEPSATFTPIGDGDGSVVVSGQTITAVQSEFFVEWNPKSNVIERQIFVEDVEPLQQVIKATAANKTMQIDTEIADDTVFNDDGDIIMYIHLSAVSISWDGLYYIASMRDANGVFALNRVSLELAWMFGGELPKQSFAFTNTNDRFADPHDAQLYAPSDAYPDSLGTLCMMDDGMERALCEHDDYGYGCYSRAICFALDLGAGVATNVFEFSFPNNVMTMQNGTLTEHQKVADLYNLNGGSFSELHGGYFIAFTSIYKAPFNNNSWGFEVSKSGVISSISKLPHVDQWSTTSGTSGLYRAEVLQTIAGESTSRSLVGKY